MTVAELIEKLTHLPQDAEVLRYDYEYGTEEVDSVGPYPYSHNTLILIK